MGATVCKCGGDTTVTDSRPHGKSTRRRRKCLSCGERWSTLEVRGQFTVDKPALMREAKRVKAQERKRAAEGATAQGTGGVPQATQT